MDPRIQSAVFIMKGVHMSETILKMKKINKIFPGTQALRNVDFEVRKGEIHSVIGTNGSGKSTLMNILAGVILPTSGTIEFKNETMEFHSPSQAMKKGIVMIHQELKLIPEISVSENIYFGRFFKHKALPVIDWTLMNKETKKIIGELNNSIDPKDKISSLSVAEQQMVEIAKALSQKAEIIIMDEPTASLTLEETKVLFKIIRDVQKKGVSIIYISHRLDEVLEISDRITVLKDSQFIATMSNDSSVSKERLVKLMLQKEYVQENKAVFNRVVENKTVLSAKNIWHSNKVFDVSFDIKKGEVLGIAGLLGSGRTELLKCIFGALPLRNGEFHINSKRYNPKSPKDAVRNGIALISEDRKGEGLVLSMSILDNMAFPNFKRFLAGPVIKQKKLKEKVQEQVKALNLKCDKVSSHVSNLSGGNQQKVVLGKWMLAHSDIILMDEPTRGIDVGAKEEVYSLVRDLAQKGKSIIFVSSELEEVKRVSDRILVMYNGRITGELYQNNTMEEILRYATGTVQ